MAVSTWCLKSQFSTSAMLPMPRRLLDLFPAIVGDGDGLVLFVDDVVFGEDLGFALLDLFAEDELGNDLVDADDICRWSGRWGPR